MGKDKGLITGHGKLWAERAHDTLAAVCDRVIYSIHPQQVSAYAKSIRSAELLVDSVFNMGPLGGLLSVHVKFPDSDFLLLACDMTKVTAEDLKPLVESTGDIVAYKNGDFFEPLCAYYSAIACAQISQRAATASFHGSLQRLLHELSATPIIAENPQILVSQNEPTGN